MTDYQRFECPECGEVVHDRSGVGDDLHNHLVYHAVHDGPPWVDPSDDDNFERLLSDPFE